MKPRRIRLPRRIPPLLLRRRPERPRQLPRPSAPDRRFRGRQRRRSIRRRRFRRLWSRLRKQWRSRQRSRRSLRRHLLRLLSRRRISRPRPLLNPLRRQSSPPKSLLFHVKRRRDTPRSSMPSPLSPCAPMNSRLPTCRRSLILALIHMTRSMAKMMLRTLMRPIWFQSPVPVSLRFRWS